MLWFDILFLAILMLGNKHNKLPMNIRSFHKIGYQLQKTLCQNDDAGHLFRINNDLPPSLIELQVSLLF